jgi:hypothetical protein
MMIPNAPPSSLPPPTIHHSQSTIHHSQFLRSTPYAPRSPALAGRQIQHDVIQQIVNNPNLDTWQDKALALATA